MTDPLPQDETPEDEPGAALLAAVSAALPDLEGLTAHADVLGPESSEALVATIAQARARLTRDALHVVVVGEQKSGKSTFLNAMLGARVLGTAARECTATVTRLRWAAEMDYTARFEDGTSERFAEVEPHRAAGLETAIATLERVRDTLAGARVPLAELPAAHAGESALPAGLQEALVDAYRSLAAAAEDREQARDSIPEAYRQGGGWLKRLASFPRWRRAVKAIDEAEFRYQEAARGVVQAQRYLVERRIGALRQAAEALARERREHFFARVHDLTDHAGRGRDVAELELAYPGKHLPHDLVLVDTPGVNTENALHRERAWSVIREDADGCWLVSDIQQALSASTRGFIQQLRPYVAHAFLVLTKVDRALANAADVGGEEPRAQVEEARKLAVKRFARELDRSPKEVFAVAVAAERALADDGSPLAAAFAEAVDTLVTLARQERAIVLGARAAGAVRRAVRGIERVGETAREVYEGRLARLEAQRIPRPEDFLREQLELVRPRLAAGMRPLMADVVLETKKALARQQTAWQMKLLAALDEEALKAEAARVGAAEPAALEAILEAGMTRLRAGGAAVMAELEGPAFGALRERYRVAQEVVGTGPTTALVPAARTAEAPVAMALADGLGEALGNFETDRLQLGMGGAAAGAAVGSLVLPGVGTLVGALVGSLAAFFVSLDDLKADCVKQLEARTAAAEPRLVEALERAGEAIEAALALTLERSLADALHRFQAWIDELLAAERRSVEELQGRLDDLQARREALRIHEATLERLNAAAVAASRGLARSPEPEATPGATVRLNLRRRGSGG